MSPGEPRPPSLLGPSTPRCFQKHVLARPTVPQQHPAALSIPPGSASQVQGAAGPACALWFVSPAGCKLALRVPSLLRAFSTALCEV